MSSCSPHSKTGYRLKPFGSWSKGSVRVRAAHSRKSSGAIPTGANGGIEPCLPRRSRPGRSHSRSWTRPSATSTDFRRRSNKPSSIVSPSSVGTRGGPPRAWMWPPSGICQVGGGSRSKEAIEEYTALFMVDRIPRCSKRGKRSTSDFAGTSNLVSESTRRLATGFDQLLVRIHYAPSPVREGARAGIRTQV